MRNTALRVTSIERAIRSAAYAVLLGMLCPAGLALAQDGPKYTLGAASYDCRETGPFDQRVRELQRKRKDLDNANAAVTQARRALDRAQAEGKPDKYIDKSQEKLDRAVAKRDKLIAEQNDTPGDRERINTEIAQLIEDYKNHCGDRPPRQPCHDPKGASGKGHTGGGQCR